jgi:hypothetical protein
MEQLHSREILIPFSSDECGHSAGDPDSDEDVITNYHIPSLDMLPRPGPLPTISVTPHSPASKIYPVLEDSLQQVRELHESVQHMRNVTVQGENFPFEIFVILNFLFKIRIQQIVEILLLLLIPYYLKRHDLVQAVLLSMKQLQIWTCWEVRWDLHRYTSPQVAKGAVRKSGSVNLRHTDEGHGQHWKISLQKTK